MVLSVSDKHKPKSAENQHSTDDVNKNIDKNDRDTSDNNSDVGRDRDRKKTSNKNTKWPRP